MLHCHTTKIGCCVPSDYLWPMAVLLVNDNVIIIRFIPTVLLINKSIKNVPSFKFNVSTKLLELLVSVDY